MHRASLLFTFFALCCFIAPCRAESPNKVFQWQFTQSLSTSLPSCRGLGITVKPFDTSNNTLGIAPYFMMSIPVNDKTGTATPHVTPIGSDPTSLSWTVDQPINSQLMLYVVDSAGSSGGVPPQLFTVTEGTSTQCIPAASTGPAFTVSANVTTTLNTCQPWGLTIVGGARPYNLTLAALNSPVVTNVTLGPNDDAFTFIDRADPGTQLIAAVSDLNGRWAVGTPIVTTAGSSDTDCVGLVSSAGNSTQIKEAALAAAATEKSRHQSAVVAGVVVSLLVVLLLAGTGVFLYLRRRKVLRAAEQVTPRKFEAGGGPGPASDALSFEETGTHVLSINAFIEAPGGLHSPPKSPSASMISRTMSTNTAATPAPFDRRLLVGANAHDSMSVVTSTAAASAPPGLSVRNPSHRPAAFSNFPTASVRRSAKSIEAGMPASVSSDSEFFDLASSGSGGRGIERSLSAAPASTLERVPSPMRSASVGANTAAAQEIIYQHQDAGIVRELPPPYIDRGGPQQ